MKEIISSITTFFKERTQNPFNEKNRTPFAGAFLIAFLIYNWELFYTIFNFDESDNRAFKISVIRSYIETLGKQLWLIPLFFSFLSIVAFYTFNNISLGITVLFNRYVKPMVLQISDRGQIIDKESYNKVQRNYFDISKDVQDLRELNIRLTHEHTAANDKMKQMSFQLGEAVIDKDQVSSLEAKNAELTFRQKCIYAYDNKFYTNDWVVEYPARLNPTTSKNIIVIMDGVTIFRSTNNFNSAVLSEQIALTKTFSSKIAINRDEEFFRFELGLQAASFSSINAENKNEEQRSGDMLIRVGITLLKNGVSTNFQTVYANNRKFTKVNAQKELKEIWDTVSISSSDNSVQGSTFDSIRVDIQIKPGIVGDEIRIKDLVLYALPQTS